MPLCATCCPAHGVTWTSVQRAIRLSGGVVAGLSGNVNSRAGQSTSACPRAGGDEMLTQGGRSHPRVNYANAT